MRPSNINKDSKKFETFYIQLFFVFNWNFKIVYFHFFSMQPARPFFEPHAAGPTSQFKFETPALLYTVQAALAIRGFAIRGFDYSQP